MTRVNSLPVTNMIALGSWSGGRNSKTWLHGNSINQLNDADDGDRDNDDNSLSSSWKWLRVKGPLLKALFLNKKKEEEEEEALGWISYHWLERSVYTKVSFFSSWFHSRNTLFGLTHD